MLSLKGSRKVGRGYEKGKVINSKTMGVTSQLVCSMRNLEVVFFPFCGK